MTTRIWTLTLSSLAVLAACVAEELPGDGLADGHGDRAENFRDVRLEDNFNLERSTIVFTGNPQHNRFQGFSFIADEGDKISFAASTVPDLANPKPEPLVFVLDDNFRVIAKSSLAAADPNNVTVDVTLPASPNRRYMVLVRDRRQGEPTFDRQWAPNTNGVAIQITWDVRPAKTVGCALTAPDQKPESQSIRWVLMSHGGSRCRIAVAGGFDLNENIPCNGSAVQEPANLGLNHGVVTMEGVDGTTATCTLDVTVTR